MPLAKDLPSVDVIFPISEPWMLPYLRNAIESIQRQRYPSALTRIYISLYCRSTDRDFSGLLPMAQECDAVVVSRRWSDAVFNIGKAYNQAARCGCGDVVACFDADVVFHSETFRYALKHLRSGTSTVVPVVRSNMKPDEMDVFGCSDQEWKKITDRFSDQRVGVGNIMVPRHVFRALHGFDERMHGWGSIDEDLYFRAMKKKSAVYLSDHGCPKAIHQKHRANPTRNTVYSKRNRELMMNSTGNMVRNPKGWGGVVRTGLRMGRD